MQTARRKGPKVSLEAQTRLCLATIERTSLPVPMHYKRNSDFRQPLARGTGNQIVSTVTVLAS
jgi:hypothetical protein